MFVAEINIVPVLTAIMGAGRHSVARRKQG